MKLFVLALIFFTFDSNASIPGDLKKTKEQILSIKSKLAEKSQAVLELKKQINRIEDNLQTHHQNHLRVSESIKDLQSTLVKTRDRLELDAANIHERQKKLKSLLSELILNQNNSLDFVIKKKVVKNKVAALQKELTELETEKNNITKQIEYYQLSLNNYQEKKQILDSLMLDLENNKQGLSKNYLKLNTERGQLEQELTMSKVELLTTRKKIGVKTKDWFSHPVKSFSSLKKSSKGVTYKFNGQQPIFASLKGRVVYLGELASYGQVIMLDHGKGIRSVLLGNISFKINKDDLVKKGELLGYTRGSSLETSNLYFEIRKKNIAQNTSKWIK